MNKIEVLDDTQVEYQPLPEVYQIELTSACDLQCPMCLRTTTMERKPSLLDVGLLQLMKDRGDFGGTTFIELQLAGEPTIHPRLGDIIDFLHGIGLLVGMSTHGLNLCKGNVAFAVRRLDTLTISIDSVDPEIYHKMRYPATLEQLMHSLEMFLDTQPTTVKMPFIEFQLIKTPLVPGSGDIDKLKELIIKQGWDRWNLRIRTQKDTFIEMQGRQPIGTMPRHKNGQICMNPFSSVSVNEKGDVLSCCLIFDPAKNPENVYGNLYKNSLAEIWNSEPVIRMRQWHRDGRMVGQCAKCYTWSPVQIHSNIIRGLVQLKG